MTDGEKVEFVKQKLMGDYGTVRVVLINEKGEESTAFEPVIIPKNRVYWDVVINKDGTDRTIHFKKDITFPPAKHADVISHAKIEWDDMMWWTCGYGSGCWAINQGDTMTIDAQ